MVGIDLSRGNQKIFVMGASEFVGVKLVQNPVEKGYMSACSGD